MDIANAPAGASLVRTIRHESEHGRWELAHGRPGAMLRGVVLGYQGYVEDQTAFATRLETPHPNVVLIVNLGPAIRISDHGRPTTGSTLGSFVAGLHDRPVLVGATGPMRCVQVDLTPIGAARLLRTPMHELVNRTVSLDELIGAEAGRLEEQLDGAPDWPARFALLDDAFARHLASGPQTPAELRWALGQLRRSGGRMRAGELADALGWSRKHLAARFRDQIGLPPKPLARVIRFDRVVRTLHEGPAAHRSLVEVALACGYSDQAHFNREFRAFSGLTPRDYLRRIIPEGGIVGD